MGDIPTKFLIDGIDRLGKSTLIQNIQEELGYYLVIHYDKPKLLANYVMTAECLAQDTENIKENQKLALRMYQEDTNIGMFMLMKTEVPIIFDRTHLGEMVYAPLYRGYTGDYVYQFENELIEAKPYTLQSDVRMILLTSSNLDMLPDDGLSFDATKKAEEQQRFIEAFNRSKIPNKVIVDVHNGQGGYKSYRDVFVEAVYKSHQKEVNLDVKSR